MSVAVVVQSTNIVLRAYGSFAATIIGLLLPVVAPCHKAREVWIPVLLVQSNLLKFSATEEVSRFYYLDDQKYLKLLNGIVLRQIEN